MAYTFPLGRQSLSDLLRVRTVKWSDKRNDELSGVGSGRTWQASLADPLWTAQVALVPMRPADMEEIAAIIRKLQGAKNSFAMVDPAKRYPKADPAGTILGAAAVIISAIGGDRQSLTFSGLPAGYVLTRGDKAHANYGPAPSRRYFFEVSETVAANGAGVATFEVFPAVPLLLTTGTAVTLALPSCRGFIVPGSFDSGTADAVANVTAGAGFTFMERR